jgi:hypothetical protein
MSAQPRPLFVLYRRREAFASEWEVLMSRAVRPTGVVDPSALNVRIAPDAAYGARL